MRRPQFLVDEDVGQQELELLSRAFGESAPAEGASTSSEASAGLDGRPEQQLSDRARLTAEARLVEEVQGPLRYGPFFSQIAELFDWSEQEVEATLAEAVSPRFWKLTAQPGVRVHRVTPGKGLPGVTSQFVRFSPGIRFPTERPKVCWCSRATTSTTVGVRSLQENGTICPPVAPMVYESAMKVPAQIDRVGRPAISTALVETFNSDEAVRDVSKDSYNAGSPDAAEAFNATVRGNLAILDSLGGCGTQLLVSADETPERYDALAAVLLDDQLYVDSRETTCLYLGVEGLFVESQTGEAIDDAVGLLPANCGGRTLTDDVIERSYSVLAAGLLVGVDDTITSDGAAHDNDTFPFLAPPN